MKSLKQLIVLVTIFYCVNITAQNADYNYTFDEQVK